MDLKAVLIPDKNATILISLVSARDVLTNLMVLFVNRVLSILRVMVLFVLICEFIVMIIRVIRGLSVWNWKLERCAELVRNILPAMELPVKTPGFIAPTSIAGTICPVMRLI